MIVELREDRYRQSAIGRAVRPRQVDTADWRVAHQALASHAAFAGVADYAREGTPGQAGQHQSNERFATEPGRFSHVGVPALTSNAASGGSRLQSDRD